MCFDIWYVVKGNKFLFDLQLKGLSSGWRAAKDYCVTTNLLIFNLWVVQYQIIISMVFDIDCPQKGIIQTEDRCLNENRLSNSK